MDPVELDAAFNLALEIARKAGKLMQEAVDKEKEQVSKENYADIVTETDKQVEQLVADSIKERFPNHCFIGEETVSAGGHCVLTDAPTWIVDPVDGTTNFVHAVPVFCISIALAVNKQMQLGVVYNAIKDEMFTARAGQGAHLNGQQIHVADNKDLKTSLVVTEFGNQRDEAQVDSKFRTMRRLISSCHGIRCSGSAALNICTVARGEMAAYYEQGLHCWDMAAGELILREAGGLVSDVNGNTLDLMSRRFLGACTPELSSQLQSLIEPIEMKRD